MWDSARALKNKIVYPFRMVKYFLVNVWVYRRILWNDRDWDFIYFLELLQCKLNKMEHHFRYNAHIMDSEKVANQLKICSTLTQRILDDRYGELEWDKLDNEYGEMKSTFQKTEYGFNRLVLERPLALKGTPEYEKVRKKELRISKKADEQRKNDINYLFSYMAKYLQTWWD